MVKISNGRSYNDKIMFSDSEFEATATRMTNGDIETVCEKKKEITFPVAITALVVTIILWIIDIKLMIPFLKNSSARVYIFYSIIATIYGLLIFISINELSKVKNVNLIKNHGAEHKVFKAYHKLKRIPTVSEAKEFSRINFHCGINKWSSIIVAQIIAIFVYLCTGYIISEMLMLTIAPIFATIFPFNIIGNIAQFWTTCEPEDSNIELAIAALKGLEDKVLLKEKIHAIVDEIFKR
ncbi:MAG: DUF1385 domain-containing protein [Clostridia bacterium]|jgi:uncharacterized protein YqhQ|nr:DUF1385 domain-containing protein [Clostridia bacterium]